MLLALFNHIDNLLTFLIIKKFDKITICNYKIWNRWIKDFFPSWSLLFPIDNFVQSKCDVLAFNVCSYVQGSNSKLLVKLLKTTNKLLVWIVMDLISLNKILSSSLIDTKIWLGGKILLKVISQIFYCQ